MSVATYSAEPVAPVGDDSPVDVDAAAPIAFEHRELPRFNSREGRLHLIRGRMVNGQHIREHARGNNEIAKLMAAADAVTLAKESTRRYIALRDEYKPAIARVQSADRTIVEQTKKLSTAVTPQEVADIGRLIDEATASRTEAAKTIERLREPLLAAWDLARSEFGNDQASVITKENARLRDEIRAASDELLEAISPLLEKLCQLSAAMEQTSRTSRRTLEDVTAAPQLFTVKPIESLTAVDEPYRISLGHINPDFPTKPREVV